MPFCLLHPQPRALCYPVPPHIIRNLAQDIRNPSARSRTVSDFSPGRASGGVWGWRAHSPCGPRSAPILDPLALQNCTRTHAAALHAHARHSTACTRTPQHEHMRAHRNTHAHARHMRALARTLQHSARTHTIAQHAHARRMRAPARTRTPHESTRTHGTVQHAHTRHSTARARTSHESTSTSTHIT